jgi:hypothetical protein
MIKVYQIQLTDAEIAIANEGGSTDRIESYFERGFDSTFKSANFQHYTHVANVDTNDMEEAFQLMNLWEDETKVEKLGPCSSMSVGDILVLECGWIYRCASFGFTKLTA